ncbi:transporter substrate-binding domain-containing protein [Erwinia sp. P7711]|uniref:transporter substrate-binding domain-containing protein n=1 Tax=Erwinia sp. P7711 TaxID=3141451 RepID=UPI0031906FAC
MHKLVLTLLITWICGYAQAADPLRFASVANNPPFEFMNADNQLVGFDIDLAKALCERMQQQCIFTSNNFEHLLPSLKFRRYDAVISGLDITEERKTLVDFTDPYHSNSGTLVAGKGLYSNIEQLKGKRVGIGAETTQQAYLKVARPEIVAVIYDNYQNALLDMRNGRLDGIFGDTLSIQQVLESNPQLGKVGAPITDSRFFGIGLGIAVRKGNSELRKSLNEALQSLKDDGTLHQLSRRWFGPSA